MPIRFRCAYCSQLMGIARRKSGAVVSCPRCHGQVVVPDPGPEEPAKEGNDAAPHLFDGIDMDQLLAPAAPAAGSPVAPAPAAAPAALAPPALPRAPIQQELTFDVEQLNTALPPDPPRTGLPGVYLSPTVLLLLTLLGIVLLALAFVGGLLVGKTLAA